MRGRSVAALLVVGLFCGACGSGGGEAAVADARAASDGAVVADGTPPGMTRADAAPVVPDAAPMRTDAAPMPTDAAPMRTDAAPMPIDAAPMPTDAAPMRTDAAPAPPDATTDAARPAPDAAPPAPDAAPPVLDAAPPVPDAALPDAALPDAAVPDAAVPDAEVPDAEVPDAAVPLPRPVLNEVQCRGDETIEVFNAGDAPLDAAGWIVTDNPVDPAHDFALPADLVVPPGGFALASGLPFGIDCGGDTLRLLAPDRSVADEVRLGDPLRGDTWGRLPDGTGEWQATRPTPGAPNALPGVPVVRLNEIDCHDHVWVELVNAGDGPADLTGWTLTDDLLDPAAAFPLDGTLEAGELQRIRQQDLDQDGFAFGIECGAATITLLDANGAVADQEALPATVPAAYTWGRLPDGAGDWAPTEHTPEAPNTPPVAPAPELFDPDHPFLVDLTLDAAAQQALAADPRTYVPATLRVTVGDVASDPMPVGVHIKGRAGSYRTLDRKSAFKVKIDFADDAQRLYGLKKITLNNQVQDPSIIHEFAAYSIFREVGVPAPRLGYAFVRVNDQIYGLYAHIETYDDVMLDRYLPSTRHLYEGAYGQDLFPQHLNAFDLDEGDPMDRSDLAAIIAVAEAPPPEGFYAATQDLIDWPEVLKVMATEIYIGHWDGYAPTRNNYYFHFDDDGRLRLFPWGTDQTFSRMLPYHDGNGRMLQLCRVDAACLAAFDEALGEVVAAVDRLQLDDRIVQLAATLRPWSEQDVRRDYSLDAIAANQQATLTFLDQRRADVALQFPCLGAPDADGDGHRCFDDCDDDDPTTWVGAPEICGDGRDNDCNGLPDDGDDCPDCQEVWHGAHRYLVCPNPRAFDDVARHCEQAGSAPVVVDGPAENAWLAAQSLAVDRQAWWWLGLSDAQEEGRFASPDGRAPTFTSWGAGQPDDPDGAADCVVLRNDGYWDDQACADRHGVLCEDACPPGGLDADHDGIDGCGLDCDDSRADVHPGAREVCGDGIDNDCNGLVDDGPACICTEYLHDGHRYLVCTQPLPFDQARLECQSRGADLAIVDDADEDAWLYQQAMALRRQDYWIGLRDSGAEGQFTWVDFSDPAYTHWGPGQPDDSNGSEDCVGVQAADATWSDLRCITLAGFVCEAD